MSAPAPGATAAPVRAARRRLRRAAPLVLLAAAVVAVAVLGGPTDQGIPLDPRSPAPLGTKALVDTLRELGADIDVTDTAPGPDVTAALILSDVLDEGQRDEVRAWVEAGGRLVVADPRSPFSPPPVGTTELGFVDPTIARGCDLPVVRDVERVAAPGGATLEAAGGARGCFPRDDGFWLVATAQGEGAVVALGGPTAFTNGRFGDADNAVLAAALLAPEEGSRVAVLRPPAPGEGAATLGDLVPRRVRLALLQLAVAFGVVVGWRARRLGRPVLELQTVQLAGSETVVAVGNLLQHGGARRRGAELLRHDLHRTLAERLGLPASLPPEAVADAAAARTGLDRDRVLGALAGPEPAGEDGLVRLAQEIESVRLALTPIGQGAPRGR